MTGAMPALQPDAGGERSFYFDIVRGVSAQLVLAGHALNVCFPDYFMTSGTVPLQAKPGLFYMQNLGVLVFFCISGYLVTASVVRRQAQPGYGIVAYLLDRFARIFTPLVPLLLILFVVENLWFGHGTVLRYTTLDTNLPTLLLNLTMLFDHPLMSVLARLTGWAALKAGAFGTADQLWTVVIEWWIYVSFGLLAFPLLRHERFGPVRLLLLALAALLPAYMLWRGNGLIVAWLVGMAFRLRREQLLRLGRRRMLAICLGSAVASLALLLRTDWNFYNPLVAALFSTTLLTLYHLTDPGERQPARWSMGALLKGLSAISYSVYLVHLSVLFWLLAYAPSLTGRVSTLPLLLLCANVAAILFYLCFERHYGAVRSLLSRPMGRTIQVNHG